MKRLLPLFIMSLMPLSAMAEMLECLRAIEIEDQPFVYKIAPKVETRIPKFVIDTVKQEVTYFRQRADGKLSRQKSPYTIVPPNEEFETWQLVFKTEAGETILNSSQPERGRFIGTTNPLIITELFEGGVDANAWTYLCPLGLKSVLKLEKDLEQI